MTEFRNEGMLEKRLNPRQLEGALAIDGPLLILAGAGSGKTRVLTYRIAHIISSGEATPGQILAVTFTNKAAKEMQARVQALLKEMHIPVYETMWINTFHSTCVKILRSHIELLDYKPFFVIYDDADQLSMIKKVCDELNLNDKLFPAKTFKAKINEAKTLGWDAQEATKHTTAWFDKQFLEVYKTYESRMRGANALDFGDLLLKTHELFKLYPDLLAQYQKLFRFIMVDEYQDTNRIQYLVIQQLAKEHRNLCVVGDEDQSIYSWRGADITNILNFESDFPEAKIIKLEENYRSTQTIVKAASHLIKNNSQRKDKSLFTQNPLGDKITIREENTDYDEARYVVQSIKNLMATGDNSFREFAVFYRTNAQSRVLEDQLRSNKIPYRLVGGIKFYERLEIKDLLAFMKLILNPADDISAARIINVPARGIGKTTVEKIIEQGQKNSLPFLKAIDQVILAREVNAGATRKLRDFTQLIGDLSEASIGKKTSEVFQAIIDKTNYVNVLKLENTTEAEARIQNIEEFYNAIRQFESERGEEASLQNFLEEMALVSDVDKMVDDVDSVTLMTLHISKGLEFPYVFIVGVEEGLFPGHRAIEDMDPTAIEEERRLAYVGMTRAEKRLVLTHARSRRVWGQEQSQAPSRFLEEIPNEFVQVESSIARPKFLDRYTERFGELPTKTVRRPGRVTDIDDGYQPMPDYEGESASGDSAYVKGMKVRHPTFGIGTVYLVEGSGQDQKVSVLFNDRTLKKFVIKYARLERV